MEFQRTPRKIRPYSRLGDRFSGRIHMQIHIRHCSRTAFYHFSRAQPGTPVNILICKAVFHREYFIEQPFMERKIIGGIPHQGHCAVRMRIHKAGHGKSMPAADPSFRPEIPGGMTGRRDKRYPAVSDPYIGIPYEFNCRVCC